MEEVQKCVIVYTLGNGTKLYVSKINMRSIEEKEIHLTDNIRYARFFDAVTAENIVLMNWWKHIGTPSVVYMNNVL